MKFSAEEVHKALTNELLNQPSPKDIEIIEDWLKQNPENSLIYNAIKDYSSYGAFEENRSERILKRLKTRINAEKEPFAHRSGPSKNLINSNNYWLKIAAIIILAFSIGYYLALPKNESKDHAKIKGDIITKANPKGQRSTIFLSDGSKVILNAGSKIYYSEYFKADTREIRLEGEAYFEVAEQPERPFKVFSGDITTTALGTAFNVNAYPGNEEIKVSLTAGSVEVKYTSKAVSTKENSYLKPGQQMVLNKKSGELMKKEFTADEVLSWKDGVIYFNNADMETVIQQLEQWYGASIELKNNQNDDWSISAEFKNQSLEYVLTSLSYIKNFDFSINGQHVVITLDKN